MLDVRYSTQYKRDMKACARRKYDMDLLKPVIDTLRIPAELPQQYRNHDLGGQYKGYQECHIMPDWLLVYKYDKGDLLLYRTGTHSDLF